MKIENWLIERRYNRQEWFKINNNILSLEMFRFVSITHNATVKQKVTAITTGVSSNQGQNLLTVDTCLLTTNIVIGLIGLLICCS